MFAQEDIRAAQANSVQPPQAQAGWLSTQSSARCQVQGCTAAPAWAVWWNVAVQHTSQCAAAVGCKVTSHQNRKSRCVAVLLPC